MAPGKGNVNVRNSEVMQSLALGKKSLKRVLEDGLLGQGWEGLSVKFSPSRQSASMYTLNSSLQPHLHRPPS